MVSTCGSGPVGRCCSASISFTRAYSLRLIGVPSPPAIASSFPLNKTWLHVRSNFASWVVKMNRVKNTEARGLSSKGQRHRVFRLRCNLLRVRTIRPTAESQNGSATKIFLPSAKQHAPGHACATCRLLCASRWGWNPLLDSHARTRTRGRPGAQSSSCVRRRGGGGGARAAPCRGGWPADHCE